MRQGLNQALRMLSAAQQIQRETEGGNTPCSVFGVCENAKAHLSATFCQDRTVLIVTYHDAQARHLAADLSALCELPVLRLPPREQAVLAADASSREMAAQRLQALGMLSHGEACVVVASVEAALAYVMAPARFHAHTLVLKPGKVVDPGALAQALADADYERVDVVEGAGQFSVRGGIVDIFGVGMREPVRVEFFDDEIDTMRAFDVLSQRSSQALEKVVIYPAAEALISGSEAAEALEKIDEAFAQQRKKLRRDPDACAVLAGVQERLHTRLARGGNVEGYLSVLQAQPATILDYTPKRALVVLDEPVRLRQRMETCSQEFGEAFASALAQGRAVAQQAAQFADYDAWLLMARGRPIVTLQALERSDHALAPAAIVRAETRAITPFQGRVDFLCKELETWRQAGMRVFVCAGSEGTAARLSEELRARGIRLAPEADALPAPGTVKMLGDKLAMGAEYPADKLAIVSAQEVFVQHQKKRRRAARKNSRRIEVFTELSPGDYIVHDQHGVGVYEGVVQMVVEGARRDYLHLRFAGTDQLYVPTDQMDRVQKYIGAQDAAPRLSKLGGSEWSRTKARVKQSIADMAAEIVSLYAKRQALPGHAFAPDTPWQREFEERFPYEETPDQLTCSQEIKRDMEQPIPMDRLLCGDVGYGKTEVALRAAFKAVSDSKQVAILVPTTLLAQQHYHTVMQRFEGFPVTCEMLSRFRTPAEQKEILSRVADGSVDIIVGTHRLLAKDVHFHDLGLLIVDEEQRFGVIHKDRIKAMKSSVDVLTLSATPIPRTLHMSMVGIRDMSVLETPPEERFPVQTYVMEYQDGVIADAIRRELARDGQVYVVYNRVRSIEGYTRRLRELVPEARIAFAHGQMGEGALEALMIDFMAGDYDVLVCTTIIENGLDIPRVNTMVVCDADRFGLAQLYQLRGRVGRSNRLAYAYFTYRRDGALSETAEKRLRAITEFTQFGSGFKIAMRDLEIRGAGNLLGAEQHGHMSAVGYEMYCRLMDEAVQLLRGKAPEAKVDTRIDVALEAYIPEDYIQNEQLKIQAYQRIAAVDSDEAEQDVVEELIDRYGEPPAVVLHLLKIARLRARASSTGVLVLTQKQGQLEMRLSEQAPIDGQALFDVLAHTRGLSYVRGVRPILRLVRKGADARALLDTCMDILAKIRICQTPCV
nr:transcription-repair coupling factor [Maliibacterium massiliense]